MSWHAWSSAFAIGVGLLVLGDTGPKIRHHVSNWFTTNKALQDALEENKQLKAQLASARKTLPTEKHPRQAQLMVSRLDLIPPTDPEQKATLTVFLDNRGDLAAEDWTVNTATVVTQHRQTPMEEQQGVAVARMPLLQGVERRHIQPGDVDFRIDADEPRVTLNLKPPFYYYVYICVVYRDKAHERQHWVTEYGAFAVNGFDRWHSCGNRRIFLEDD